jgi:hypothetical protein
MIFTYKKTVPPHRILCTKNKNLFSRPSLERQRERERETKKRRERTGFGEGKGANESRDWSVMASAPKYSSHNNMGGVCTDVCTVFGVLSCERGRQASPKYNKDL